MRDLSARTRRPDLTTAILLAFALLETAGGVALIQGGLAAPVALAGHGLCLAAAAAALHRYAGRDLTFTVIGLLLCAWTGPVGAAGATVLRLIVLRTSIGAKELAAWYRRLAGVAQAEASVGLYDSIVDGRARRPTGGIVDHFPTILSGGLAQQQALLGLIGLGYHPDYRPILAQALCSTEPSIRVHAAAVSVKLRARTLAALKRAQDEIVRGTGSGSALAATLLDLADGGFLDEAKARAARESALGLCRRALVLQPNDADAAVLQRRALVDLGCPDGTADALADPSPAHNRQDMAVRLRGLMQIGDARALHALLAARPSTSGMREMNHAG